MEDEMKKFVINYKATEIVEAETAIKAIGKILKKYNNKIIVDTTTPLKE